MIFSSIVHIFDAVPNRRFGKLVQESCSGEKSWCALLPILSTSRAQRLRIAEAEYSCRMACWWKTA